MKNNKRRIFTALCLVLLITAIFPQQVYASSSNTDTQLDRMGAEVFKWYKLFLAVLIPLLITRFASYGLQILGTTFLSKGEFTLDKIKQNILYCVVAAGVLYLLPSIIGWAMGLFESRAWKPPTASYIFSMGDAAL